MVHNNKVVNAIYDDDGNPVEHPISSDDLARLNDDGICAQVAGLDGILFSGGLSERALMLHVSMAIGSIFLSNDSCAIFEAMPLSIAAAFTTLASVTAGKRSGVTAEQLSKVFCIPHDDAARTLSVTTQLVRYNTDSSLSRNVSTNDCALRYRKFMTNSSLTLYLQLRAQRVLVAIIYALKYLSLTKALYCYTL